MKKFFIFILSAFCSIGYSQTDSYSSNIFTDSPISLSSGHYSFSLPLFNMETSSSLIPINAQLNYHSKSVRSIYSGSMFGNGFSLNILPVISRDNATDETVLPGLTIGSNGTNPNPDVYSYNVYGLSGKFFVYVKGGVIKVQVIEQSDYAQIKVYHDTGSGPIYSPNTYQNMYFSILDKNGTEYIFKTKENRPYQISSTPTPRFQNRFLNLYLTSVLDKSKKEIFNYTYSDYTIGDKTLKQISEINIPSYGRIKFNIENATVPYVRNIEMYDEFLQLQQTADFSYTSSHLSTRNLSRITYKTPSNKSYYYQFNYNPYVGVLDDNGYYWTTNSSNQIYLPFGINSPSEFSNLTLLSGMTSGALSKVILPTGGSVDFLYEPNDFKLEGDKLYTENMDNYDFNELPKTATTVSKIENSLFVTYKRYTITVTEKSKLYYKIRATGTSPGGGFTDPDGNPVNPVSYPNYKIYSTTNLTTPLVNSTAYESTTNYNFIVVNPGTYYLDYKNSDDGKFIERSLKIHSKKTANLQYFNYAPGIRIKSIKEQANGKVKSETVFHYKSLAQINEKVSSGYSGLGHSTFSKISLRYMKDKKKEFVYYTNVTKEIKGKGFIEYDYGDKILNDTLTKIGKYDNLRKFPKTIRQFDLNKNLTEEMTTNYTFDYLPLEINENTVNAKPQGIIKNQTSTARTYQNNQLTGEINQSIEFSTQFRAPVSHVFTDAKTGETKSVENSYQKLGNEVVLSNVKSYINNNLLSQVKYNYQQKLISTSLSFYNLSSYFEENKFGEIVNSYEVTKTDSYGNIVEYKDHLGVYHSIVWGYNNGKKLFEISDLKYDQIDVSLIQAMQTNTSSQHVGYYQNPNLILNLYSNLRIAHPHKLITTYTYYTTKGIRSVTDPNGRITNYEYDNFGRLISIKDNEGNAIKTYQYNFINGVN